MSYQNFISVLTDDGREGTTLFEIYDLRPISGKRLTTGEINSLADFLSRHPDLRPDWNKTAVVVSEEVD